MNELKENIWDKVREKAEEMTGRKKNPWPKRFGFIAAIAGIVIISRSFWHRSYSS